MDFPKARRIAGKRFYTYQLQFLSSKAIDVSYFEYFNEVRL